MHAAVARRADRVLGAPSGAYCKFLECCPFWKRRFEAGVGQPALSVGGEAHAGLPHFTESLRPEPGKVNEPREGQQRLVRRDVRGRLLAPDVLLAGLQGQDIAALARGVERLTDDPARHAADEFLPCGEEPVMRPGEGLVVAGALTLADRHAATVGARCFQHT